MQFPNYFLVRPKGNPYDKALPVEQLSNLLCSDIELPETDLVYQ